MGTTEVQLKEVTLEGGEAPGPLATTRAEPSESVSSNFGGRTRVFNRPAGFVPVGKRPRVRVIRGPGDLSEEWVTSVYQMRGFLGAEGRVTKVSVKPLGGGLGVMGDIALVHVELEGATDGAPTGFVAKFCPQQIFGLPRFLDETMAKRMFGTEARWYNDFMEEEIGLPKPQAYFVGAKLKHRKPWRRSPVFCMLIELMPPPLYSLTGGCDHLPHLLNVVEGLATFHALWWEAPKKKPVEYIPSARDYGGIVVPLVALFSRKCFAPLARCFGEVYGPVLAWKPLLKGRHKRLVRMMVEAPLTLTHGDVHLDNIFFDDKWRNASGGGGFKLIDFGNMQFLQGCFDVASLLGTCIEPAARAAHEKTLIEAYHRKLVDGLSHEAAAAYPLERCWRDYRLNLWRMVINVAYVCKTTFDKDRKKGTGIYAETLTKSDASLKATYDARNRRLVAALVDNDFRSIIEDIPRGCCC